MPNLLFCGVYFHRKPFYLTINITDIISGLLFTALFISYETGKMSFKYPHINWLLDLFLFFFAILALIFYLSKQNFHTEIHKIYMFVRLFISSFKLGIFIISFFEVIISANSPYFRYKQNQLIIHALFWQGFIAFQSLSVYWSFQLKRIIK